MKTVITSTIKETYNLAQKFIENVGSGGMILCLEGNLGAGKTTFAQGVLAACGAQGPYTSPTFNIVKEYDVNHKDIKKIYHIDAYRVKGEDMRLIGWDDIISDKKGFIIIEWPENVQSILPHDVTVILCEWVSETEHKYIFK